jgi:D-glycero-D-manno-heptose 1,7-bisphosphate phosphatase
MADKFIFVDRDGVINEDGDGWTESGYILKWKDFNFLPRVLEAFRKMRLAGYKCVVVSNQQCVGKKLCTQQELDDITEKMTEKIRRFGGEVEKVYYCVHNKETDCSCRKPKPGLFVRAKEELGIGSFDGIFYVGDTERDIVSGRAAGLKTILVFSGKTLYSEESAFEHKPDHTSFDLMDAVEFIIKKDDK